MNVEIKKSQNLKLLRVIVVGLIATVLVVLAAKIVGAADNFIPWDTSRAATLFRIVITVTAVGAVVAAWMQDRHKRYVLDDDKLIITNKSVSGSGKKQIITLSPKTVSKLDLDQSLLGKTFDYGTIVIEVDNYSSKQTHQLQNIDHPHEVLTEIDSHMHMGRKQG